MIFPIPTEVYNIYDKQDKTYYLNTQPRTRLFYLVLGAFEEVVLSARGGGWEERDPRPTRKLATRRRLASRNSQHNQTIARKCCRHERRRLENLDFPVATARINWQ